MSKDPYSATWVSHTSISDWLVSPRLYYLKNVYRDPKTRNKIQLMKPPLALGQAVHEVLEGLSTLPVDKRFEKPLLERFETAWQKVSGKQGGFFDKDVEHKYKERGQAMLRRVSKHPGPLKNLAVKINMDLPHFWLSEDEEIILCGKIDWVEYLPDENKVHIIDFKTGKSRESDDSLQLAIYALLVSECQQREVKQVSYWYLDEFDAPVAQDLPQLDTARDRILAIARDIKLARKLEKFDATNSTREVKEYERVLAGKAEFVGTGGYGQDTYVLPAMKTTSESDTSTIL